MLRGDIATRVAARLAARTVRAYEPDETQDYDPPPEDMCYGPGHNGCPFEGTADPGTQTHLCERCDSGVLLTAMETLLPWDSMESNHEIYGPYDQWFQELKQHCGGQQAREEDLQRYPNVVQTFKNLADQISSKLGKSK